MMIPNIRYMAVLAAAAVSVTCSRETPVGRTDTGAGEVHETQSAGNTPPLRGTVISASTTSLVLHTDTGAVTVKLVPPLRIYAREPANLDDVKENSFIGVTSVKQRDGTEQAMEIHIFPEALRGLGEGSRMMSGDSAGMDNRMTNGAVANSRMTNGSAEAPVSGSSSGPSANGASLVVQYAGGSRTVIVPPETPVTEIKPVPAILEPGDKVFVMTTRAPDGSLSSNAALLTAR
jgi:hypothetical protein